MGAYRTGTYVAFDGQGESNPTKSDFGNYGLIKAWNKSKSNDFRFSDSHEKTYSVKDISRDSTLKSRLQERFRASKNMVVLLSDKTNWDRGVLNWEIEQAVDVYEIPLIIVYNGYNPILVPSELESYWPKALKEKIKDNTAKCIHIPFKQKPLFEAINQFTVQYQEGKDVNDNNKLTSGLTIYTADSYKEWGLIK